MALELKDLATRTIGKAVGRQHGLLLNFTKAPSNPIASLLLEAVPAFLLSSFGINDRAALATAQRIRRMGGGRRCGNRDGFSSAQPGGPLAECRRRVLRSFPIHGPRRFRGDH